MIVVLEGPDFAGKSTLALEMRAAHGGVILANGPPPAGRSTLRAYYLAQVDRAADSSDLVVFDRLHVGELIYGPIFRGASLITVEEAAEIDAAIDVAGGLRFFVSASPAELVRRMRGPRGDDLVKQESELLEISKAYDAILSGPSPELEGWRAVPPPTIVAEVRLAMKS